MREVVCWCCEYFVLSNNIKSLDGKFINGSCKSTDSPCFSENTVCENFILRSGLHTTRTVPDYCKNQKPSPLHQTLEK